MVQRLVGHDDLLFLTWPPGVDVCLSERDGVGDLPLSRQTAAAIQHVWVDVETLKNKVPGSCGPQALDNFDFRVAIA